MILSDKQEDLGVVPYPIVAYYCAKYKLARTEISAIQDFLNQPLHRIDVRGLPPQYWKVVQDITNPLLPEYQALWYHFRYNTYSAMWNRNPRIISDVVRCLSVHPFPRMRSPINHGSYSRPVSCPLAAPLSQDRMFSCDWSTILGLYKEFSSL